MAIALMPNSCELVDSLGRSWAIQVKPAGSDPAKYAFVPGVTSCQVNLETTGTGSTTIDMDGWSGETKTGRSLNVVLEGIYKLINGLAALPKTLELLEEASQSDER